MGYRRFRRPLPLVARRWSLNNSKLDRGSIENGSAAFDLPPEGPKKERLGKMIDFGGFRWISVDFGGCRTTHL